MHPRERFGSSFVAAARTLQSLLQLYRKQPAVLRTAPKSEALPLFSLIANIILDFKV
jgi:hypothetical protein